MHRLQRFKDPDVRRAFSYLLAGEMIGIGAVLGWGGQQHAGGGLGGSSSIPSSFPPKTSASVSAGDPS
jgi:hypothetical protein